MSDQPKFKRAPAEERREALIAATLELIAEYGVSGATVRAIAQKACVTQGLIRHYFSSKEDLITAAYASHMMQLTKLTDAVDLPESAPAKSRLAAFVRAGLRPPVATPQAVSLWAGFLTLVRSDPDMQKIHDTTYHDFRDRLERLIDNALKEDGIVALPQELRRKAIACNALVDGLWMEGGALPDAFEPAELPEIGVNAIGTLLGLNLEETEYAS